ncbi:MAG: hypothetical protein NZM11_07490 [Anaerolineales bacterium]|nr:hypothetical protein [Anaerolineales bacterium]
MSRSGKRRFVSRRAFLALGLVAAATLTALPPATKARLKFGLRVAAALPTRLTRRVFADADALAAQAESFDLLLLPAYVAAGLIRAGQVQRLSGPPGRAHDPDGAFTVPHSLQFTALFYRGAAPEHISLDHLFQPGALWPNYPRLMIALALLRRGYLPNDEEPPHLLQVEDDLRHARPVLVTDPLRALQAGRGRVALGLLDVGRLPGARLPEEGVLTLEYDWVIPRCSSDPAAAEAFVRAQPIPFRLQLPAPAHTLGPLSPDARRRYAALWSRLNL